MTTWRVVDADDNDWGWQGCELYVALDRGKFYLGGTRAARNPKIPSLEHGLLRLLKDFRAPFCDHEAAALLALPQSALKSPHRPDRMETRMNLKYWTIQSSGFTSDFEALPELTPADAKALADRAIESMKTYAKAETFSHLGTAVMFLANHASLKAREEGSRRKRIRRRRALVRIERAIEANTKAAEAYGKLWSPPSSQVGSPECHTSS